MQGRSVKKKKGRKVRKRERWRFIGSQMKQRWGMKLREKKMVTLDDKENRKMKEEKGKRGDVQEGR